MSEFGSRFLIDAALMPRRISGERWGSEAATLDLPGGPYRLTGLTTAQRESLQDRFARQLSDSSADIEISVFRAPAADFSPIDTRGWEYTLDVSSEGRTLSLAGLSLMARIDGASSRGGVWTPCADRESFWPVVENVLRPLVAYRLLWTDGLLVHSSAVSLRGRGFLFAGHSGAGKSTIAHKAIAAALPVLSDDLNAIAGGDHPKLLPVPFAGDLDPGVLSAEAIVPERIVTISKGSEERIEPVSPASAAALLARCAPFVSGDPAAGEALMSRVSSLAARIPALRLTFRLEADIWPILENA